MRKHLHGALRALLIPTLGLSALAVAAPAAHAQATLEKIKQRGQINVGYRAFSAPFSSSQKDATPTGYTIDLCQPIIESLRQAVGDAKLPVRYVETPVDARLRMLGGGNVDLLCENVTITPERSQRMGFSEPVFLDAVQVAVRTKDNIQSLDQLQGKTIVAIDGTTAAPVMQAYAKTRNLQWDMAKAVNAEAALGQLQLGWASGYARDGTALAAQINSLADAAQYRMLPDRLSVERIAIAFRKDDAGMAALVNNAIKASIRSGAAMGWYDKWFLKPTSAGGKPLFTEAPAEMKKLLAPGQ
ncbi:amino acid ABC transporter substrate-binding protein [Polaromonas sp. YR568]|uniref:amino acid ABC transporter substrate-binding protein n=1 Tax=Polaromonas sp. YR568 TaxID=1855301 RepID=UPI003138430C